MDVVDSEVISELTFSGHVVADFFLIAGLVCSHNACGGLMGRRCDDQDLATATVSYLRRIGVTEYPSIEAYLDRGNSEAAPPSRVP